MDKDFDRDKNIDVPVKGYEVGYKKPPKSTRFKKGISGNPKGRPKKPSTLNHAMAIELGLLIPIRENGKTRYVNGFQAISKKTLNMALNGDRQMIKLLYERIGPVEIEYRRLQENDIVQPERQSPEVLQVKSMINKTIGKKLFDVEEQDDDLEFENNN